MEHRQLTTAIVDRLRGVIDPCCRERDISVVDMGLLHEVDVNDHGHAQVKIMLTSGWCPFQVDLVSEIEDAVAAIPEIVDVSVSITLEQAWSTDRLSNEAATKLQFLPAPSEVGDPAAYVREHLPVVTSAPSQPTIA